MHQGNGTINWHAGRALVVLTAGIALAACATGNARSAHYQAVNFSAYQTFAWATEEGLVGSADADPQTVAQIRSTVERELSERGLSPATTRDEADLLLTFTLGSRAEVGPAAYPEALQGPWRWRGLERARRADYAPGTLAIDLFDRAAGQPVWHGWAQPDATDAAADTALADTVTAILQRYPPRGGSRGIYMGSSYSVFGAPGQ